MLFEDMTLPASPGGTNPLDQVLGRLDRIDDKLDSLMQDVMAPPRGNDRGGLLARQTATEDHVSELKRIVADLQASAKALEAAPGRSALNWTDRLAMMGLASLVSALAGMVGWHLQGGIR